MRSESKTLSYMQLSLREANHDGRVTERQVLWFPLVPALQSSLHCVISQSSGANAYHASQRVLLLSVLSTFNTESCLSHTLVFPQVYPPVSLALSSELVLKSTLSGC